MTNIEACVTDEPMEQGVAGAQAVRRAMQMLRLVALGQEEGVRLVDLVAMSGLSPPTARRILRALVEEQAIQQDQETRRYRIGREITLLGLACPSQLHLRGAAGPILASVSQRTGETAFLGVRQAFDSVCIGRSIGSRRDKVLSIEIGMRTPLGAAAAGHVLLMGMTDAQVDDVLKQNASRLRNFGLDLETVFERVEVARERGFAWVENGIRPGTHAVAVPVRDAENQVIAALTVVALKSQLSRDQVPEVASFLMNRSAAIRWTP
ncbi:IclR family transcriptional regulator [Achromobacter aloeverae]